MKMAAFNKNWFVGTLGKLQDNVRITELYNLKEDPMQLKNLVKNKKIFFSQTIEELKNRIKEMVSSTVGFGPFNKTDSN